MPDNVYEVIAQGARYWFLFWMALIAWRSWRWYRKDRRAAKKRLKLLPDAGYVGELVVVDGGETLEKGTVFPVPWEGTLGALRTNDLWLPESGVAGKHLWFRFDRRKGLMVQPFGRNAAEVDGRAFESRRRPLYMSHGSWLCVAGVQMRLRLFAGFESTGHAVRRSMEYAADPQQQRMPDEQYAQMWQQWQLQQQYAQQQAWQQGYQQAMAQQMRAAEESVPEMPDDDPDTLPYDLAQIAREEGLVDNSIFMRPRSHPRSELPVYDEPETEARMPDGNPPPAQETVFYPPVVDDEPGMDEWVMDEDMTDAAAPPRSAYIGSDEAERAKREVWDKYFGGGQKR